jgi:biopolymer transport protein ExbD
MEFKGRKRMHYQLNITSMIDIVLLLLIFFMLTSSFINQRAIKIDLPESNYSDKKTEEDIVISINSTGGIFLDQKIVGLPDLPNQLKEMIDGSEKKNVVIRGDKNVDFGTAIRVMDIVRGAGAEGMTVATEMR